jgi:hypothetical protein
MEQQIQYYKHHLNRFHTIYLIIYAITMQHLCQYVTRRVTCFQVNQISGGLVSRSNSKSIVSFLKKIMPYDPLFNMDGNHYRNNVAVQS